jgi:hypothetical protein
MVPALILPPTPVKRGFQAVNLSRSWSAIVPILVWVGAESAGAHDSKSAEGMISVEA